MPQQQQPEGRAADDAELQVLSVSATAVQRCLHAPGCSHSCSKSAQALRQNYRALSVLLHDAAQQAAQSSTQLAAERNACVQLDASVQQARQAAQQAEQQQLLQQAQAAALEHELAALRAARHAEAAQQQAQDELMARWAAPQAQHGRHA